MTLTQDQEEALKIAVARYKNKEAYTCIAGYAGSGKAQPNDTSIPTPNGNKLLGELKIGDYVFNREGKPVKITGVYPQGPKEVWKVTLKDGRSTLCCEEHLFSYYDSHNVLHTSSIKNILKNGLQNSTGYKYKIPTNKAVEITPKKLPIDPYVVGVFLGDGCCVQRQLTLSSQDEEIVAHVASLLDLNYEKTNANNYSWVFPVKDMTTHKGKYRQYEILKAQTIDIFAEIKDEIICKAENKKIPQIYKDGSIQQKFNLIQGLMDTDGSITESEGRYNISFSSISKQLILDLQEMLWSLGIETSIHQDIRKEKYTTGVCYQLTINMPNEEKYKLFRLSRKLEKALQAKKVHKRRDYNKISIISIEPLNYSTEMTCIMVDDHEHLYLTNDYIVTHNTTLVKFIIAALNLNPEEDVCYCAFTGRAASILQSKGCANAQTAHKLLYKAKPLPNGKYKFIPKIIGELPYKLITVDEISMLPMSLWNEILKHKIHVLALGDPMQLPVINKEEDNHILDKPHYFLTKIMRQSLDSEIIRFSMWVREGKPVASYPCENKEVKIFNKNELNIDMLNWADQVLVATNIQRNKLNALMRESRGFIGPPQKGDKIISLRNHWEDYDLSGYWPLTNGVIGYIDNMQDIEYSYPKYIIDTPVKGIITDFTSEDGAQFCSIPIDYQALITGQPSLDGKQTYQLMKAHQEIPYDFTYGYAITTHKAQGSSWPKVLIKEEWFPNETIEHRRWLYTSITRAESRCVLITK